MALPLRQIVTACALSFAPMGANAQNLVTNGDFESINSGWTISAGANFTTAMRAYPATSWLQAYSGNYYANFGEVGASGSMSQTLTTVSGYKYVLSFYLYRARESYNVNAGDFFTASAGGQTLFSTSGLAYGLPYKNYSYSFQATSTSTLLEFTGQDNQDEYVLDTVSVVRITPDATNSLTALSWDRSNLRALLSHRSAMLSSMMDYDCAQIRQNLCVTLQARSSGSSVSSDGAGVLVAALALLKDLRIGAFLDQPMGFTTPIRMSESATRPGAGVFAVAGQDDAPGWRARVSFAARSGSLTLTRDASLSYNEAGSGAATLRERGFGAEVAHASRWGKRLVSPFAGLNWVKAERGAYSEGSSVYYPLTYAAFGRISRSLRLGLRSEGQMGEDLRWRVSLGTERELSGRLTAFSGTSDIPSLTSFSLAGEALPNSWRPLASVGVDYRLQKNVALTGSLSHRGGSNAMTSLMGGFRLDL